MSGAEGAGGAVQTDRPQSRTDGSWLDAEELTENIGDEQDSCTENSGDVHIIAYWRGPREAPCRARMMPAVSEGACVRKDECALKAKERARIEKERAKERVVRETCERV